MDAGRELDALVAERVMGLVRCTGAKHGENYPNTYCYAKPESPDQGGDVRSYSTSIEDAWEVVERMARCHPDILRRTLPDRVMVRMQVWADRIEEVDATADTAPHATCLAALKAVGAEVPA